MFDRQALAKRLLALGAHFVNRPLFVEVFVEGLPFGFLCTVGDLGFRALDQSKAPHIPQSSVGLSFSLDSTVAC